MEAMEILLHESIKVSAPKEKAKNRKRKQEEAGIDEENEEGEEEEEKEEGDDNNESMLRVNRLSSSLRKSNSRRKGISYRAPFF